MRSIRFGSVASALLCASIVACGGGGGGGGGSGSSSGGGAPVNTTPPTATISAVTPTQRVTHQPISFTGTGTTVTTGTLTYSWNFGDGSTGSGASATHSYSAHGNFTVTLTVRDAGGLTTTATQTISLLAPPATPVVVVQPGARTPNAPIQLSATATDPQGGSLVYTWDFGDGTHGTGADVSHAYAATGNFTVRATATNALGLASTSAGASVPVAWLPLFRPSLVVFNTEHLSGQTLFAFAPFTEPNGLPYTLEYDFGDSTSSTVDDTNTRVHRTYASPGTYIVRVTARSAAGESASFPRTVEVAVPTSPPVVSSNVHEPFCSGPFCGAANATSYSGTGVGVWRYHNSTATDATINVSIGNVRAGLAATLVFSNGSKLPTSLPLPGLPTQKHAPDAHEQMLESNRRFARALSRGAAPATPRAPIVRAAAPPVGATRTWRESAFTGQTYNLVVAATCTFSTGRNGVIWVDADQVRLGELDIGRANDIVATLCGPTGAYEHLITNIGGDLWGSGAAAYPALLQDTPELQDLHIVIPGVPAGQFWGGYFSAGNLGATPDPNWNAALSVVLNGRSFAEGPDTRPTRSTLVHELKHLGNYYQRWIVRGSIHSQFAEEMSAMLAEDLISPLVSESRSEARISGYTHSGAGIDLIGWTHPQGQSYNMAGAFGVFLHRRYGAALDRELITMCADLGQPEQSYDCVDQFIQRHGGHGFADELARMGASTLGMMSNSRVPSGFGYPGLVISGAALPPISNWIPESPTNSLPLPVTPDFGRTMHTFSRDYIGAGQTTFQRSGVVVPAGTTLVIVVSEPHGS